MGPDSRSAFVAQTDEAYEGRGQEVVAEIRERDLGVALASLARWDVRQTRPSRSGERAQCVDRGRDWRLVDIRSGNDPVFSLQTRGPLLRELLSSVLDLAARDEQAELL